MTDIKNKLISSIEYFCKSLDFKCETDNIIYNEFTNIITFENIKKTLLIYQIPHVNKLYELFTKNQCLLDASDTGTGKSYTTVVLCIMLGLKPFIICPKSVINTWITITKKLGVIIYGISNYEKLKTGKYYTQDYEVKQCEYMEIIHHENSKKKDYKFDFPDNLFIVIDEAHKCKNHKSDNGKLLMSLFQSKRKMLLLSATLTDKIEHFKQFGILFGFYNKITQYSLWVKSKLRMMHFIHDYKKDSPLKNCTDKELVLKIIHTHMFPHKGSRMKISELGDLFPQNQIIAKCYYSDDHKQVNQLYTLLNTAFLELKQAETRASGFAKIIKCRMAIEIYKIPIILDLIDDSISNNYSVVVFVNYINTMNHIVNSLNFECSTICGNQTLEEREKNINDFQENRTHCIVCIIQAGNNGISLHDLHGRPRISIISPSWSGTEMIQIFGRIHRAGSKSHALQRIVYIAGTYEEQICDMINNKINVLSGINDGDLVGSKLDIELLKEVESDIINKSVVLDDFTNITIPNKKKYITF
jgi:hypothetical protein